MRYVDLKSFTIGGLLVGLTLCLLGAEYPLGAEDQGRFQIETNPDYAFVLDTTTGQVWSTRANLDVHGGIDPNIPFSLPKRVAITESDHSDSF